MQLSKGAVNTKAPLAVQRRVVRLTAPNRPQVRAAAAVVAEKVDWNKKGAELEQKSPLEILDAAFSHFGGDVAIAFSGAEDVALIEYANLTGKPFRVFSLDTGRLNPETYRLFDKVEKHYKIKIEYTFPDAQAVMDLVNAKGMFSFYEDGHTECCRVRKVQPLRRKLKTLKAWVTGQRKDQSPGTRQDVPVVQVDPVFEGLEGGPGSLVKFNPLSNATSAEVWNLLRTMNVPVNELHSKGYVSIGCEPCTKAVLPNQLEREGRWWWEDAAKKECGLHSGNIKGAEGAAPQNGNGQQPTVAAAAPAVSKPEAPSASPAQAAAAPSQRLAPSTAVLSPPAPSAAATPTNGAAAATNGAAAAAAAAAAAVPDLWQSRTSAVEALTKEELQSLAAGQRDKSTLVVLYAPWCQYCQGMESDYEELAGRLRGSNVRVAKYQADVDREFAKTLGLVTFPTVVLLLKGRTNYIKFTSTRRDPDTLGAWVRSLAGSA